MGPSAVAIDSCQLGAADIEMSRHLPSRGAAGRAFNVNPLEGRSYGGERVRRVDARKTQTGAPNAQHLKTPLRVCGVRILASHPDLPLDSTRMGNVMSKLVRCSCTLLATGTSVLVGSSTSVGLGRQLVVPHRGVTRLKRLVLRG